MKLNIHLDHKSAVPMYVQLREALREFIARPDVRKAGAIPKEEDICRELGLSRTTVRRAISALVSEGLLHRIKRKGTMIVSQSRAARVRDKKRVGIVFPISESWKTTLSAMHDSFSKAGYQSSIALYHWDNIEEQSRILNEFHETTAGMVIYPNGTGSDKELIAGFHSEHFPMVLFDTFFDDISTHSVALDNTGTALTGTQHLIAGGARKIALLTTARNLSSMRERSEGYELALRRNGIPFSQDLVYDYPKIIAETFWEEGFEPLVLEIVSFLKTKRPDAVLCARHEFALAVFYAAKRISLRIPEDLAVVAFDSSPRDSRLSPSLTVLSQPVREAGRTTARLLVDTIENRTHAPARIRLQSRLVQQGSSGADSRNTG